MNTTILRGSGNSLVGSRDDGYPTYEEFMNGSSFRFGICKHCFQPIDTQDALDECCNGCLPQEKIPWYCQDCGHDWFGFGISLYCPECQSFNLNNPLSNKLNEIRSVIVVNYHKQKAEREKKFSN